MQECAADALDNKVEFGVWGGMTERQRRALLKQHPEVVSWSDYLEKRKRRTGTARIATQGLRIGAAVPSLLITVWLQQKPFISNWLVPNRNWLVPNSRIPVRCCTARIVADRH